MTKWFRCDYKVSEDASEFSVIHTQIKAENEADICGANPVDKVNMKGSGAKVIVKNKVKSCFGDKTVTAETLTICPSNDKYYRVKCGADGKYAMSNGNKTSKYDNKVYAKFVKDCQSGAASFVASNALLAVLIGLVYF